VLQREKLAPDMLSTQQDLQPIMYVGLVFSVHRSAFENIICIAPFPISPGKSTANRIFRKTVYVNSESLVQEIAQRELGPKGRMCWELVLLARCFFSVVRYMVGFFFLSYPHVFGWSLMVSSDQ
jgi:hypothetical protein